MRLDTMMQSETGIKRLSLLLLGGALVFVILVWMVVANLLMTQRQTALNEADARLLNLAKALAYDTERSFDTVNIVLGSVAEEMGFGWPRFIASQEATHRFLFNKAILLPAARDIIVVGAGGDLWADSGDPTPPVLALGDRDYYQAHLGNAPLESGLFIGAPVTGRTSGKNFIGASRRIVSTSGDFLGVVTAIVEPVFFTRAYSDISIGKTGQVEIFRMGGSRLALVPEKPGALDQPIANTPLAGHSFTATSGIFKAPDSEGRDRLYAFRVSDKWPVVVAVSLSVDEALETWRADVRTQAGLALLATLVLSGLTLFLYIQLRRREQVERALGESAAFHSATLSAVTEAIIAVEADGTICGFNPAAEHIFGYDKAEIMGQSVGKILPEKPFLQNAVQPFILASPETLAPPPPETTASDDEDVMAQRKDGSHFPIELTLAQTRLGERPMTIGVIRDITERRAFERDLLRLANEDSLTGLPNRRRFLERLEEEVRRAQRYGHPLALLMADLDHFKNINDTHGHAAGDVLLKRFAHVARTTLRETDLAGRLGGEEFAILLPDTGLDGACVQAERLRKAIFASVIQYEGKPIFVTVSLGVAVLQSEDQNLDNLLERADSHLYEAKRAGRNRVVSSLDQDEPVTGPAS